MNAIYATNTAKPRELIPAANYIARCYYMVHLGHITEVIQGQEKVLNKVRIGWELPQEMKVFDQAKGEQPCAIYKDFTLSLHEKASLRKMLDSWRGKAFSAEEAKNFDITKLIGAPCMINLIHKPSKDGTRFYEEISSISAMPKGVTCPKAINQPFVLSYDGFDELKFNSLPDFIKDKMRGSKEFKEYTTAQMDPPAPELPATSTDALLVDDLPF